MKKCPFCAEEIQDEAIKCRFCKELLPDSSLQPESSKVESTVEINSAPEPPLPEVKPEPTYPGKRAKGDYVAALLLFLTSGALFKIGVDYGWYSTFSAVCVVILATFCALGSFAVFSKETKCRCPLCQSENTLTDGSPKTTCMTCKLPLEVSWQTDLGKKSGLVYAPAESIRKSLTMSTVSPSPNPGCLSVTLCMIPVMFLGVFMLKPKMPTPAPVAAPVETPEEISPAVLLARAGTGNPSVNSGPEVAKYAALLSRLQQKFPDEDPMVVAKISIAACKMLQDKGSNDNLVSTMEAIDRCVPIEAAGSVKINEVGAMLVTLVKDKRTTR